jgi:acetyltransferase-like isoleucine patch superfamily enzyme
MRKNLNPYPERGQRSISGMLTRLWVRFWMRFAGMSIGGQVATRLATWLAPPHKAGVALASMNRRGYVAPGAIVYHGRLKLGDHVYIGDGVTIFQRPTGGAIEIGDHVYIYRDVILETGYGGHLTIGARSSIHPRCQLNAYVAPIEIGSGVMLAPNCALYSYDHGLAPDQPIRKQPVESKGAIVIGDDTWLGFGAIVLSGVRIGRGAAIAAGAIVMHDVPDGAIVAGAPARVVRFRTDPA